MKTKSENSGEREERMSFNDAFADEGVPKGTMKFIVLNCAGLFVEMCAVNGDTVSYKSDTVFKKASEVMLKFLDEALTSANLKIDETDFIACCIGPGSFTGIRIALTTARSFAHALNKKIVSFTTSDVLAYNGKGSCAALCVSDAGNGFVYIAKYDNFNCIEEPFCIKSTDIPDYLSKNEVTEIICDENTENLFKKPTVIKPGKDALINAALNSFKKNGAKVYSLVEPLYIRLPQAEADLEKKSK